MARLALGLDSSTQSLSSIVLNIDAAEKIFEHSLDYRRDGRLNHFAIGADYIIPPRVEGEADQPIEMILASLDAMFHDLRTSGVAIEDIILVNNSAQQHGHVYLNNRAESNFARLRESGSGDRSLVELLAGSFFLPDRAHLDDLQYRRSGGVYKGRRRGKRQVDSAVRIGRAAKVHGTHRETGRRAISRRLPGDGNHSTPQQSYSFDSDRELRSANRLRQRLRRLSHGLPKEEMVA